MVDFNINKSQKIILEIKFYFTRFPFYYWIKIAIVLWMNSPVGSTLLYKRFIHPVLKEREQVRERKKYEF